MACSVVIRDPELSCLSRFEESFLTHTEPATELIEFEIRNLKLWCSDPNLSQFFFLMMIVRVNFVRRMPWCLFEKWQ